MNNEVTDLFNPFNVNLILTIWAFWNNKVLENESTLFEFKTYTDFSENHAPNPALVV